MHEFGAGSDDCGVYIYVVVQKSSIDNHIIRFSAASFGQAIEKNIIDLKNYSTANIKRFVVIL